MAKGKGGFDKFIHAPVKGAKKKEQLRQEKKADQKERRESYDKFYEEKRQARAIERAQQPAETSTRIPFKKTAGKKERIFSKAGKENNLPVKQAPAAKPEASAHKEKRTFVPLQKKDAASGGKPRSFKPKSAAAADETKVFKSRHARPYERKIEPATTKPEFVKKKPAAPAEEAPKSRKTRPGMEKVVKPELEVLPLNKYIAHGGICSRRDAADLVKAGKVKVNGILITEPGHKVQPGDEVKVSGKKVVPQKNFVYILLNKPKDFITTAEDPQGRKTVMDIIKNATEQRVYPVGRLDRNTSGVLLLTNDGDLAQQLTHPSFQIRKMYEAKLDKPLSKEDFERILTGITLEDGEIHADAVAYADPKDKSVIGIEIHSGRNRIVRRIFEHLGYDVKGLDRVMFANLTKKNVERGHYRMLNDKEVRLLKYFNKSKKS